MAQLHIGQIIRESIKQRPDLSVKAVAEMIHITEQGLYQLLTKEDVYIKRIIELSKVVGEDLLLKIAKAANYTDMVSEPYEQYNNAAKLESIKEQNNQLTIENNKLKDEILNLYRQISALTSRT